jgi:hypothetical protein
VDHGQRIRDWPSLFINGGITHCRYWQGEFVELLTEEQVVIVDPRRDEYDYDDPAIEREQIAWEFQHRNFVHAHSFWFSSETLCPITLLELGKSLTEPIGVNFNSPTPLCSPSSNIGPLSHIQYRYRPVFLGIDPEYKRKSDLEIQTELLDRHIKIAYSLEELAQQVKDWLVAFHGGLLT